MLTILAFPFGAHAQWFADVDTFKNNTKFIAQVQGNYFLNSNSVPVHIVNRFLFGGKINESAIEHVNERNGTGRFGFDASYGASFRWKTDTASTRFFGVSFQNSNLGGARFSNQLLQLGLNGNSYFNEQEINFEPLKFRFFHLQSLDFGFGFQTKNWTINPSIGLSRLINFNEIDMRTLRLYSSIDSLNYRTETETINSNGNQFNQNGIAIQTGINLSYQKQKWRAHLSINRLGLVVNSRQLTQNNYTADTSFTGFRVNDLNSLSVFNIEDSLNTLVNQSKRSINQQGLALPASFQVRITRLLSNSNNANLYFLNAGIAYQSNLFQQPLIYLSGQWQKNVASQFTVEGILFSGPYSVFDVGLKMGFSALKQRCQIRLAAPSLSGFLNSNRFGNSSLHLQLAYQW